jgi:hypothetical protein
MAQDPDLSDQVKQLGAELAGVRAHLSALLAALVDFNVLTLDQVDLLTAQAASLANSAAGSGAQAVPAQIVNEAAHIKYDGK